MLVARWCGPVDAEKLNDQLLEFIRYRDQNCQLPEAELARRMGMDAPMVVHTRAISDAVPVPVVASGGVGSLDHFVDGVVKGGASAVLAASIFHFGEITIGEAKAAMAAAGIAVRPI